MSRVSPTELGAFKQCKRKWMWGKEWRQPSNISMFVGTCIHAGLEAYYKNDRSLEKALLGFSDVYHKDWIKLPAHIEVATTGIYEEGRAILENYHSFEDTMSSVERWEIVDVERHMILDIDGITLTGRADLVVHYKGALCIVDHKTSIKSWRQTAVDFDPQITAYLYMLSVQEGEVVSTGIINALLKRTPEQPKLIRDGAALSKSRSQATTPKLYNQAITENGFHYKDYAEFIEYLEQRSYSNFFQRLETDRTIEELEAFRDSLPYVVEDMERVKELPARAYPTKGYHCAYCPFKDPCKAKDRGDDYVSVLEEQFEVKK